MHGSTQGGDGDCFEAAFAAAPIGVALLGLAGADRGRWIRANPELERLLGADHGELGGIAVESLMHRDDLDRRSLELGRLERGEVDRVRFELRLLRRGGGWVSLLCSLAAVPSADPTPSFAVAQYLDIGEHIRSEHDVVRIVARDALTGVLNRGRFDEELARALAHAARYASRGALLCFDLDHFQALNDGAGRATADAVLVSIAHAVGAALRASDAFARTGGDEFAILLPDASSAQAEHVAAKVLRIVRRGGHAGSGSAHVQLTASVGVAAWDPRRAAAGRDLARVMLEATTAMYEARDAGGDRYVVYRPPGEEDEQLDVAL